MNIVCDPEGWKLVKQMQICRVSSDLIKPNKCWLSTFSLNSCLIPKPMDYWACPCSKKPIASNLEVRGQGYF